MASASPWASGQKIGAYVLLEKLGSGGLGEVWKARDPRLNRVLALKFIHAPRQGSSAPRELLHEARAASALNHPNIVTIFEIGESQETTFLAMEFVEGETLRRRMQHSAVPLEEALDIATQAAAGLAAAQTQGLVHRDLKPENIMLRADGYVKLVDFGLAKLLPGATTTTDGDAETTPPTQSGQLVGTLTYMSPEQARGRAVTGASDVFSFGIVLYELLTGEHPFRAESVMDTLSAILNQEPKPVHARTPAVPRQVSDVVARALQKEPERRYSSAGELAEDLKRARTSMGQTPAQELPSTAQPRPRWMKAVGAVLIAGVLGVAGWALRPVQFFAGREIAESVEVRSIAVANFLTPPGDSAAELMAQALPDDLSVALAMGGMRVASRSSVMGLSGAADPREVGLQLGVDAVLAGSVRSFGPKLRIHVELVSTHTGFQLWSGSFTAESSDLLTDAQKTVEEVAAQVRTAAGGKR
jgi:TolB-like protein